MKTNKDRLYTIGSMEIRMKEDLQITKDMVSEYYYGKTKSSMMENGIKTK